MKKLIVLILVLIASMASAATLRFDASTGADGYKVYYTDGSESWSNAIGNRTEVDLSEFNLTPGTYTFSVTAYNVMGESAPSNTAEWNMAEYVVSDNPKPVTIVIPGPVTINIGQ